MTSPDNVMDPSARTIRRLNQQNRERLLEELRLLQGEVDEANPEMAYINDDLDNNFNIESDSDLDVDEAHDANHRFLDEPIVEPPFHNPHETFSVKLAEWAHRSAISRDNLDALLLLLREINVDVPKSAKTLLRTPTEQIAPRVVEPGEYVHIGIQNMLLKSNYTFLVSS